MSPSPEVTHVSTTEHKGWSPDSAYAPQRSPARKEPTCCIVLHGVAPLTWQLYRPLVQELDALGGVPMTLLVPPPIEDDARFFAAMDGRLLRGDELVVYGYGRTITKGDDGGSVAAEPSRDAHAMEALPSLPEAQARTRLREALRLFIRLDWPVRGFVAPGWRLGKGARAALRLLPFLYTTNPYGLLRLSDGARVSAPALVGRDLGAPWQASPALRRDSPAPERAEAARCVRLAIHPMDMQHAEGPGFWVRTVRRLLRHRRAITLSDRLELA
jgi:uncharacterized protein